MVQGECGAGRCGAVWCACRARVVQSMVQNKIQGVVCRASVVQGMVQGARGVRAGAVQCVWCRNMWCSFTVLEGGACEYGSVRSGIGPHLT